MYADPLEGTTLVYQRNWETSRDRLWCRAACEVLDPAQIELLMRKFNQLREEPSHCEAERE